MNPRFDSFRGIRIVKDPFSEESVESRPDAGLNWLYGIISEAGDFKTPNHQELTHWVSVYPNGEFNEFFEGGQHGFIRGVQSSSTFLSLDENFDDNAYNGALEKVFQKIRGQLDLSVSLAEAHQARSMILKSLRGLENLATTFRKMRRSNPRDWGNLWLEFTYGWKPLASDIYDTGHQIMNVNPPHITVRGRHTITDRVQTQSPLIFEGIPTILTIETSKRCEIVAVFAFGESALDSLAGFTSLNPVSIAWELVPYSFVVDWVIDVGGYLRNFESALLYGNDFVRGYSTEGVLQIAENITIGSKDFGGGHSTQASVYGLEKFSRKRRLRLTSIPYPRSPSFKVSLGWQRLLSAAALLGQLIPSKR